MTPKLGVPLKCNEMEKRTNLDFARSRLLNADSLGIDLLFKGIAIDTQKLSRLYLIAIPRLQSELNKRFLDLFENDIIETRELDVGIALLLEQDLELALDELFKADRLKVCNKKII